MARLAVAPHGFGDESLRSQETPQETDKEAKKTGISNATKPVLARLRAEGKPARINPAKPSLTGCSGACDAKYKRLEAENARLCETISQMKKTVADRERELTKVRAENSRLQSHMEAVDLQPQKVFERRVTEIQKALTHGLAHTLNTLESIRAEGDIGNGIGETPLFPDKRNPPKKMLAITGGPFEPRADRIEGSVQERSPEDDEYDDKSGDKLDDDFEGLDDNLDLDLDLDLDLSFDEDNFKHTLEAAKGQIKPAQIAFAEPLESDKAEESLMTDTAAQKARKKKSQFDDFHDITFFLRPPPPNNKHAAKLNEKLRLSLPSNSLKDFHPMEEKTKPSTGRKRKAGQDENADVVKTGMNKDMAKRRQALAPVKKGINTNIAASRKTAKKTNSENKAFDFVERDTLLEQSRSALKKSLG